MTNFSYGLLSVVSTENQNQNRKSTAGQNPEDFL